VGMSLSEYFFWEMIILSTFGILSIFTLCRKKKKKPWRTATAKPIKKKDWDKWLNIEKFDNTPKWMKSRKFKKELERIKNNIKELWNE
jgi:hypothetical protein